MITAKAVRINPDPFAFDVVSISPARSSWDWPGAKRLLFFFIESPLMSQSISVLITSDCPLFAVPLADLLTAQKDFTFVVSVSDLQETLARLQTLSVDIVLIDVHSEISKSVSLIRMLKAENPSLRIIALGVDRSEESILKLLEAGVGSYTFIGACFDELVRTIKDVYNGRTSCSSHIISLVFSRITELAQKQSMQDWHREILLTPRERDILELVSSGLSNKEIAGRLKISLFTVKNHMHNILEKLEVKCRREAILRAYESGLFNDSGYIAHVPKSNSSDGSHTVKQENQNRRADISLKAS